MEELKSLVIRAQAGDLDAYGEIVRRFQDMAYGYGYSILGDFHLAEDAAQEAFIEAYRDLPKLREPAAFPGWFRRIVFKHCDRLTRGKHVLTVPLEAAAGMASRDPGPDEITEEREMKDKVLEAIKALPENERMVTTLFYINGYSQKEIAEFLDVPVTTVKNRLHTSRKRLKERMVEMVDKTLKSFPLPGDFADVVVRKVSSEEDLKGAVKFLAPGYHGKREPGNFETIDSAQRANIYVVGEEGQVESAGYFDETVLSIGSTVLKAVRPREMAGEAEGVPSPIFVRGFQGCFKLAKEKGISLAVVHGSQYDHAFCGFVPCFYYPVVTLPCERARSIATRATITEANKEQEQAARQAWLLDPYAVKMSAYIGNGLPHVVKQDAEVVGYVSVDRNFVPADHYGMPFGHVCDITVQTREAALAVIRLAAELTEKVGDEEICLMQSHMTLITQTMLSLGGTYLLRGSCDLVGLDAEMVAIVDLVALTQNLQDEFQSRLNASPAHRVDGRFSIEMSGTAVGFVVNSGRVGIVTRKQKVHRVLPRWVVTRLYVGYYSGEDVLAMGPIPYDKSNGKTPDDPDLDMKELHLPENEAALFKALFPKLWPCSMPDPDVWPWVIGEDHPPYQGEEHKTPEMKAKIDALRFPWIGY
ncbi:MAG: RNA polymerase sigma factor [Thermodesulfobacteriota bacterium]